MRVIALESMARYGIKETFDVKGMEDAVIKMEELFLARVPAVVELNDGTLGAKNYPTKDMLDTCIAWALPVSEESNRMIKALF